MVPPITVGLLVKVLAFSVEVVPSQKYRTKFAAIASDLVTVAPVPGMTVLTVSVLSALSFGMLTAGVVPKFPVTVTDALAAELVAAAELELALALGFDEPQAAMTRQASSGTTMIARTRRMKEPQWWWTAAGVSLLALLTRGDDSVAQGGRPPWNPPPRARVRFSP